MAVEDLLSKLDKVKKSGAGKWIAVCPCHDDKNPSLAIKEESDGRILIYCFAGCGSADILYSIGMRFCDLYPAKRPSDHLIKPVRKPWNAHDVLSGIAYQVLFVWQCAKLVAAGMPLNPADQDELLKAVIRIQRAHRLCSHG